MDALCLLQCRRGFACYLQVAIAVQRNKIELLLAHFKGQRLNVRRGFRDDLQRPVSFFGNCLAELAIGVFGYWYTRLSKRIGGPEVGVPAAAGAIRGKLLLP